jgi:hypothetical protein
VGYSFFAPSILVSSNGQTFVGVILSNGRRVAFDAYNGSFTINGNSNSITGDIYAPAAPNSADPTRGTINLAGGGVDTGNGGDGFLESWKLVVNGNFADFHGTGPGTPGLPVTITTVTTTPGTVTTTPGTVTTTPGGVTTTPGTVTTTPGSVTTTPPVTNTTTTGTDVNLDE